MKKVLTFAMASLLVAVLFVSAEAEQWSFFGPTEKTADQSGFGIKSLDASLSGNSSEPFEVFSGSALTSLVPIQLDHLVVSLVELAPDADSFDDDPFDMDNKPFFSQLQLNTGIRAETYLPDSQSHLVEEFFGDDASSFEVTSSVIFLGVGLDFKSGYLKGNAFVGRPLDTLTNRLYNANSSESMKHSGLDTDALGFEASAGYKLNEKFALGAGFGRMNDKNKKTEQTEEVYAVYAQAVLAIAPGINMIPEVGQIERIKEEAVSETRDESFYAGALWEINF